MVAGTISGILFAPQSGEDTREYLRTQADELGEAITGTGQDIIETGRRQVSTVLQQGHEAVDHACAAVKSVNTKVA